MRSKIYAGILIFIGAIGCIDHRTHYAYDSETSKIEQLSENTYRHISYLKTENFGKVACNGMIVTDTGAVILCSKEGAEHHTIYRWSSFVHLKVQSTALFFPSDQINQNLNRTVLCTYSNSQIKYTIERIDALHLGTRHRWPSTNGNEFPT